MTYLDWELVRDASGNVTEMRNPIEYDLPPKLTQAEKDAARLAEHERLYGTRK